MVIVGSCFLFARGKVKTVARHRLFYSSLEEARRVVEWIEERFITIDVEDVEVYEADDGAQDEVSFTTPKKLTELDQCAIVYRTFCCCYSFNGDDY